jgi:predicted N-acetyltransferase YhbS
VGHSSHTEHFIVDALCDSCALYISLVAELDGQIIEYLWISPVSISDGSLDWFGFGPIAVLSEYQKQGIGSLLVQSVLDLLRERRATGCVLLGNPSLYGRFGFTTVSEFVLTDVPPEYLQALSVSDFYAH